MHDSIFRHVVTFLLTACFGLVFWGGYVAGANGMPYLAVVLIAIYAFLYHLIHA